MGGVPFARTQIYKILSNRLYIGLIEHQGKTYPGQHPAIIEQPLWDQVQARLASNLQGTRRGRCGERPTLLAGKLIDDAGQPLVAAHSSKPARGSSEGRVRYGYYVSASLHKGSVPTGWRIPTRELDAAVIGVLVDTLDDPLTLASCARLDVDPSALDTYVATAAVLAARTRAKERALIRSLVRQVRVASADIILEIDAAALVELLAVRLDAQAAPVFTLRRPTRLTRSGRAMRLIQGGGVSGPVDQKLVRLLIKARSYWAELRKGEINVTELAAREGFKASYLTRVLRLAFLSPAVVDAIVAGRQPPTLTSKALLLHEEISRSWNDQAALLQNKHAA